MATVLTYWCHYNKPLFWGCYVTVDANNAGGREWAVTQGYRQVDRDTYHQFRKRAYARLHRAELRKRAMKSTNPFHDPYIQGRIRTWLRAKADHGLPAGESCAAESCPLGLALDALYPPRSEDQCWSVTGDNATVVDDETVGPEIYPLPEWAKRFVERVDAMYNHKAASVPANVALTLLSEAIQR